MLAFLEENANWSGGGKAGRRQIGENGNGRVFCGKFWKDGSVLFWFGLQNFEDPKIIHTYFGFLEGF